jgi:hypothetical protein
MAADSLGRRSLPTGRLLLGRPGVVADAQSRRPTRRFKVAALPFPRPRARFRVRPPAGTFWLCQPSDPHKEKRP